MRTLLAAAATYCLLIGSAWAQNRGVDLNPVIRDVVMPLAVTAVSGIASALMAVGYAWLHRKWGLEIEAKHREALHSAIVSGINMSVTKVGKIGAVPNIQVNNPFTRMAVEYVLKSVPDAVKQFNLTEDRIAQMILAKIPQVMGTTSPNVSPPVSSG